MAIWGLSYLNQRKQNTRREEAVQDQREDEDEERWGAPDSSSGMNGPSLSPDLSPKSRSDRTSAVGDRTSSPLLRPRDASSVYQSYGTHSRSHQSQQDITLMGATTPAEVRRGKLFASLCATTVVFAWALFLVTSFIKIRSRREREGHL